MLFAGSAVFAAVYLMLMCITFWGAGPRFYLESEYMPMVIICCVPFVYYVLPALGRCAVIFIAVVFLVQLAGMHHAATPFTKRVVLM